MIPKFKAAVDESGMAYLTEEFAGNNIVPLEGTPELQLILIFLFKLLYSITTAVSCGAAAGPLVGTGV